MGFSKQDKKTQGREKNPGSQFNTGGKGTFAETNKLLHVIWLSIITLERFYFWKKVIKRSEEGLF